MPAGFLEASLSELLCMDAFPFPPGGGGQCFTSHTLEHICIHIRT